MVYTTDISCHLIFMCFSASASFVASAALGSLGAIAYSKKKNTREWPLALIPIVFAVQQAAEGFLWLTIGQNSAFTLLFTSIFLFFAFFWWPAYIPYVAMSLENNPGTKKLLRVVWFLGGALGLILYGLFLLRPLPAFVQGNSICYAYYPYSIAFDAFPVIMLIYIAVTVVTGVISRHKVFQFFSLAAGVGALTAWFFHSATFTSVWCFFAAVLSLILLYQPDSKKPKTNSKKRRA